MRLEVRLEVRAAVRLEVRLEVRVEVRVHLQLAAARAPNDLRVIASELEDGRLARGHAQFEPSPDRALLHEALLRRRHAVLPVWSRRVLDECRAAGGRRT